MRIEAMMFSVLIVLMTSTSPTDYSGFTGICPAAKPAVYPALYQPVLGILTFRIHANACVACAEGVGLGSSGFSVEVFLVQAPFLRATYHSLCVHMTRMRMSQTQVVRNRGWPRSLRQAAK